MKKIILLILALALSLSALVSCNLPFGSGGGGGGGGDAEPDNLIYNSTSELYMLVDPSIDGAIVNSLWEDISNGSDITPKIVSDTAEAAKHEIVVGRVNREISTVAYQRLERIEKNTPTDVRALIYSDGSSVAIAYDENEYDVALKAVIAYFVEHYVKSELILPKGDALAESYDVVEKLREVDTAERAEKWEKLEKAAGENGKEIVRALQNLYGIYDDGLVTWLANLFDPDICVCNSLYGKTECEGHILCGTGGFYYSNSGVYTVGFLPDAESTTQALGFLGSSGMGSYDSIIPTEISEKVIDFIYNLQDPDGFFYHPQWGKNIPDSRRSRDYNWCLNILKTYGVKTKYATLGDIETDTEPVSSANLRKRLGTSEATLVSRIVAVETRVPEQLKDIESFKAYLESLDIENKSYSAGNNLSSQMTQIKEREKTTGLPFKATLGEFLDKHQNVNGTWHKETNYFGINGLMKISGVYNSIERAIPNAQAACDAAIAAITSDQEVGTVVDLWNTWEAVVRVLGNIQTYQGKEEADAIRAELRLDAPDAIYVSMQKISLFLKSDGSFSYAQKHTSTTSQGCVVAVAGTNEGDVNATVISSAYLVNSIYGALGLSGNLIKIFSLPERVLFLDTLENLQPVRKGGGTLVVNDPFDFDDEELGTILPVGIGAPSNGKYEIVNDPREDEDGKVLKFTGTSGSGDYVTIPSDSPGVNATCYVFEGEFCVADLSNASDDFMRIEVGDGGDTSNAYRIVFVPKNNRINFWDSSSSNRGKSVRNDLGISAAQGEWFSFKIEYYVGTHDTVRIKVYFNGELVSISDNYYDNNGTKLTGEGTPNKKFTYCQVYTLKAFTPTVYLDDLHAYKTNDIYAHETVNNPFGYDCDLIPSDEEKKYTFDELPEELAVTGSVSIVKGEGGDDLLSLISGAEIKVPMNLRTEDPNCDIISLDILADKAGLGELAKISLLERNSTDQPLTYFILTVTQKDGESYISVTEGLTKRVVAGVELSATERTTLGICYYESEGITLFYVNGKMAGVSSSKSNNAAMLTFGKINISASQTLSIDNVICERGVSSLEEATKPKEPVIIHGAGELGFDAITLDGATVGGSVDKELTLGATSSVTIPINKRDEVTSAVYAELSMKYGYVSDGTLHRIELLDEYETPVVSLAIVARDGVISLVEETEYGAYSAAMATLSVNTETKIAVEYFASYGIYNLYVNGKCVYVSSMVYSQFNRYLAVESVKISATKTQSELTLDDLRAESLNALYVPVDIPNLENGSEKITFDYSGATNYPSAITGSLNSPAPKLEVVEIIRDDEAQKVLSFTTSKSDSSVPMDVLSIDLTGKSDPVRSYVFEADLCFRDEYAGVTYQLDFKNVSKAGYRLSIHTSGSVKICENDKNSSANLVEVAKLGEWFNLRVEYYTPVVNGVETLKVKVFVNGELVDQTLIPGETPLSADVIPTLTTVSFHALKASSGTILLDNVGFVGISQEDAN